MRNPCFVPSLFAWALAAVMAVALPGIHSAQAATPNQQLSRQLPPGVSLSRASITETAAALHVAVADNPRSSGSLTEAALVAKSKSKGRKLTASEVKIIVSAAFSAAPGESSDILQMSLAMYPQYADELNALALNPDRGSPESSAPVNNAPDGFNTPEDLYGGFGVGFGPGFPGSPGFSGSSPSGAIALPGGALTADVNG